MSEKLNKDLDKKVQAIVLGTTISLTIPIIAWMIDFIFSGQTPNI
jgi:hypothetical protein